MCIRMGGLRFGEIWGMRWKRMFAAWNDVVDEKVVCEKQI